MQVVFQQIVRGKITADSVANGQILQTELLNSPLMVCFLSQSNLQSNLVPCRLHYWVTPKGVGGMRYCR